MIDFKKRIILGSGSPRRKLLLKELGFDFQILISKTDEIPKANLIKGDIAEYLAEEKALALKDKISNDEILITADTIVWLDNSAINKPSNKNEAFEMLSRLNGKEHQVYTGVCLSDKKSIKSFCVESHVQFRKLTEREISEYIEIYQPFDKAGAYGAQESLPVGMNPCSEKEIVFLSKYDFKNLLERTSIINNKKNIPLIKNISGSYFNVMGLPIVELVEELLLFNIQ